MENFKQPIFNFCRRIGKKFLSNIGVSSKQILFLKNFSFNFLFLYFYYIKKLRFRQMNIRSFGKNFLFVQLHIEKSKDSILIFCRRKFFPKVENFLLEKFFLPISILKIPNIRFQIFVALKCYNYITEMLQLYYNYVTIL